MKKLIPASLILILLITACSSIQKTALPAAAANIDFAPFSTATAYVAPSSTANTYINEEYGLSINIPVVLLPWMPPWMVGIFRITPWVITKGLVI